MQMTVFDPFQPPEGQYDETSEADHALSVDEQHHAMIELVFNGEPARQGYFKSEFKQLQDEFAAHVRQVNAYRIRGAYTLIKESRVTLPGWLGRDRAQIVWDVGAENIITRMNNVNQARLSR
jgi:hypothetical protein